VVKRFPGDELTELIEKHPDVSKHLFKTAMTRLAQANSMIVKLANDRERSS
jgi:type IV pilus assembly protein PilB